MKKFLIAFVCVLMVVVSFLGCQSKTNPAAVATPVPDVVRGYSGSASLGDLVVFDINTTDQTYSLINETNPAKNTSGSYSAVTNTALQGIFEVTVNTNKFFAVELTNKIIAHNFPYAGTDVNYLSLGVSSALDNTSNPNFAGDYVWVRAWDQPVNGDAGIKEWGFLTVKSDGTWFKRNYATAVGSAPSVPFADPGNGASYGSIVVSNSGNMTESGKWAVNGTKKERLNAIVDGTTDTLTGYFYADASTASFILDMGVGQGFMMAFKQSATTLTQADIAGTYKFVDMWYETGEWPGAGNYTINATGTGTYVHKDLTGTISSGTLPAPVNCAPILNMFKCAGTMIDGNPCDIYLTVVGDVIMHLTFGASGFVSYGVGAKM